MTIHKDFADWYRAASVTPSAELLESRWRGVEAAVADLDAPRLVALLKLHANDPQSRSRVPEFLDEVFRAADTTFPSRNNAEELRVLAGAIIRETFEGGTPLATSAALGLICSSFGSRRQTIATPDHVQAADEYLARKGSAARQTLKAAGLKAKPMTRERFDELMPPNVFVQAPTIRDPLFSALIEDTAALNRQFSRFESAVWQMVQTQREELNMLWWLQTKVSRDLNIPFAGLGANRATLVLPKELADLTVFLPGPTAILGMVIEALSLAQSHVDGVTIAGAVNSVSREWRETMQAQLVVEDVGDLCPISLAVTKSLDTDGETDWFPVFRKLSDVRIDEQFSAREFALQVYTERLFCKSLSEA